MTYRIISFCGGGIRGLLSAGLLTRITERCPNFVAEADLLAGTSTGSDIISALLVPEMTPAKIYQGYQTTKMFENPSLSNDAPAYDIQNLVDKQRAVHGTRTLAEAPRKVLFTAFNVGKERVAWKELILHNLDVGGTPDVQIVDAVVSSSAMPGMYGSYQGNIDGAFVNHDPSLAAIAVAVQNGHALEDISVVCFGTGYMENWIGEDTSQWGAMQWQNAANVKVNRTQSLLINGTVSPIVNASLSGTSTDLVPNLCRRMLRDRYAYLNPKLERIIPENATDPADINYMKQRVEEYNINQFNTTLNNYWGCST